MEMKLGHFVPTHSAHVLTGKSWKVALQALPQMGQLTRPLHSLELRPLIAITAYRATNRPDVFRE